MLKKDDRSNLWAFIIYPDDSAPDNYLNIIQNFHISMALSPLHEPDPYGDKEEQFKKHIHCIIYFGTGQKKSLDQVKYYSDQLNGTRPFMLDSRNGYVRYLIHYDNPEKKQYDESEILTFSGFEIGDAFCSEQSDQAYYDFIDDLIINNKICNLIDLTNILKNTNRKHELKFVRNHIYYIDKMIDANYKRLKKIKNILDNHN